MTRRNVAGAPYRDAMGVQGELFGEEPATAEVAAPPALRLIDLVPVEQLALVDGPAGGPGRGRSGAVPSAVWEQLLDHAPTRRRYTARVYRRGDDQCAYWLGAISSTGHGKIKAGRSTGAPVVVTAHVYGWQAARGLIRPRPGEDPVIAHRCDESSCQNPAHWELIERTANGADYRARRHRAEGPLADVRGAEGRAVAIREAIQTTLAAGGTAHDVEAAITTASAAGLRTVPGLF
jgi:hypothetical protein